MKNELFFSSASDNWSTPQDLFDFYDRIYHFTLDPASTDENAKTEKHYTISDNGLNHSWEGETVWLNPPYGKEISQWLKKAYEEGQKENTIVVCLLPARTDTTWFHEYCTKGSIEFLRGRVKFSGQKNNAPFASMIVTFRRTYTR